MSAKRVGEGRKPRIEKHDSDSSSEDWKDAFAPTKTMELEEALFSLRKERDILVEEVEILQRNNSKAESTVKELVEYMYYLEDKLGIPHYDSKK